MKKIKKNETDNKEELVNQVQETKPKKVRSKKRIWTDRIIFVIALCVFIYAGFNLYLIFYANHEEKVETNQVREIVNAPTSEKGLDSFKVDFDKLKKINSDIVGWIVVEDTEISYPVVKGSDNEYYLNHTYKKSSNYAGAIFMDYAQDATLSTPYENVFIYGHNVYHGTMFAELENYCDKKTGAAFYKKHPYVYYYSPNGNYKLQIFSTYIGDAENGDQKEFGSADAYLSYIQKIKAKSRYDTGVSIEAKDKMITLYTCSYEDNDPNSKDYDENARYYVHCKLIKALDGEMPYNQ